MHYQLTRTSGRIGGHFDLGFSAVRVTRTLLFTIIVALGVLGCGGENTIWSTQLKSPDGRWLASAETVETGGFGTASLVTNVYLKWTNGSQSPENILVLVHDPNSASGTINLSMKWVTPSHLDVSYDGHARVDFQVVKDGDVDISLHDLSKLRNSNSQ